MSYRKGKAQLTFAGMNDSCGDDYAEGTPVVYLPHSCGEWVIGGKAEVQAMIHDLEDISDQLDANKNVEEL